MVVVRGGKKNLSRKATTDIYLAKMKGEWGRRDAPPSREAFVLLQTSRQIYELISAYNEGGIGHCRTIRRSKWGAYESACSITRYINVMQACSRSMSINGDRH